MKCIITLGKLLQEDTPYFSLKRKKFIGQTWEVDEQAISASNSYTPTASSQTTRC